MIKLSYYKNLDGLRALAALSVIVYHFFGFANYNYYLPIAKSFQYYAEAGKYGVSVFFMLSGFVITRILLNTKEEKNYFKSFYFKRVLRILPLYYFFLIIWFLVRPPLMHESFSPISMQWPSYFFVQNLVGYFGIPWEGPLHYWTLVIEEHFYLVWPLIIFLSPAKHTGKIILFIVVITAVLKQVFIPNGAGVSHFTLSKVDQLSAGAYLAILELNGFFKLKAKVKSFSTGLSLFILLSLIVFSLTSYSLIHDVSRYLFWLALTFSLLYMLLVTNEKLLLNKLLLSRPLQYLGKMSYGLYVWSVLVLEILPRYFVTKILLVDFLLGLFLSIVISHISYFYFESYFFKFKSRYRLRDK